MKIGNNKVVELIYELIVDGQIVDHTVKERPLQFIQGTGSLLPKFESNIEGLQEGDKFAFTLTPDEGYGTYNPELLIELPVAAFEIDGRMREDLMVPGTVIPLMNSNGGVVPGKVIEAGELFVKVDINHPMADKTLNFSGEIVSVREATDQELAEGLHPHGCGHHCHGCHGHKEDGCDGECGGGECNHGEGGCGHCHHDE